MRSGGGGGGVRILIAPEDLRRGSTRLSNTALAWGLLGLRLRFAPMPEMPPGVAEQVRSGVFDAAGTLASQIPDLLEASTELDRRALWTEIADRLMAGEALDGALLAQFMAGMKDGSLVKYAEPWQAELAGNYLATRYHDNYKIPEKLIELARILQANDGYAASGAFMAGFVEGFGPERLVDIPRVIQAMDWTPGMQGGGGYDDPYVDWDLGYKLWSDGYTLDVDAVELLGAFSMALALGTSSGRVSAGVEHDIAWDDDSWAVAQLLHEGKFGANFLKEAFQGVLMRDPDILRGGPSAAITSYMAIGGGDGEGPEISTDAKALVLQALARSPEGAALALTTDLPEKLEFISSVAEGGSVSSSDPLDILLGYDGWDDDGKLVGEAMASAVGGLHDLDRSFEANDMVELMINEVVRDEDRLDGLADGLARAISSDYGGSADYIRDLHVSAGGGQTSSDFDLDRDSEIGSSDDEGIRLSTLQLRDLLSALTQEDVARDRLLAGVGAYQTESILTGTSSAAPPNSQWATEIGNFNSILSAATDQDRIDDFEARREVHERIFGTIDAVASAIPTKPVTGFVTGELIDLIAGETEPSKTPVLEENYEYGQELRARMDAAIISGYYENDGLGTQREIERQIGGLDTPGFEPQSFFENGEIIPYGEMSPEQKATFDAWKRTDPVQNVVEEALQVANQGVDTRAYDN